MGHRKKHAPRRGSLGVWPRKKAKRHTGRWRNWPQDDFSEPKLLGFAGYKAGMTHAAIIEGRKTSPSYKQEAIIAVTVIETPPVTPWAIRLYKEERGRLATLDEAWASELEPRLRKRITLPASLDDDEKNGDQKLEKLREQLNEATEVRVLTHTNPTMAGTPQKAPDIIEIKIGGPSVEATFDYAVSKLGENISISEVFNDGDFIDTAAVTKGKGFQGPVKRFGIKILPRKKNKSRRVVGCIGPWHPARVMWTVPRAGQMGYHHRTHYNARILKIGVDGEEITPAGGFKRYGEVQKEHILLKGSVAGAPKRLIRLRSPMRPSSVVYDAPALTYVSTTSKM
ncbi:MAG: 50S ribosomal protein L3 [Candidatus Hodarchaeales archaeon]|jgi:large subunit ribosomal protein L3